MISVANMPIILSVIMLSVVMLNVVAPLVIILIVVAPFRHLYENGFENLTIQAALPLGLK
jgi:hypothetical protein